MNPRINLCLILAAAALASCRGLEPWQQAEYQEIKDAGMPDLDPKSPALAAGLNLLPGVGDAYNGEWGAFACNFLLWPFSVLWGIPEAGVTASNINKQETWAYYTHGRGQHEYQHRKAEAAAPAR